VHIDRLVVERPLDRQAFERALMEAISALAGTSGMSPQARLKVEVGATTPRRSASAIGSAIGRAIAGAAEILSGKRGRR
jgi:predicted GNAT superfamily acetyltransferase